MKYKSLAAVAAAFAVASLIVGPATSAVAKTDLSHGITASGSAPRADQQLYAQAGAFGENHLVRLDAQPLAVSSALVRQDEESAPLNLWALVVAGFAVMGSLAFRRSPNK